MCVFFFRFVVILLHLSSLLLFGFCFVFSRKKIISLFEIPFFTLFLFFRSFCFCFPFLLSLVRITLLKYFVLRQFIFSKGRVLYNFCVCFSSIVCVLIIKKNPLPNRKKVKKGKKVQKERERKKLSEISKLIVTFLRKRSDPMVQQRICKNIIINHLCVNPILPRSFFSTSSSKIFSFNFSLFFFLLLAETPKIGILSPQNSVLCIFSLKDLFLTFLLFLYVQVTSSQLFFFFFIVLFF